MNYNLASLVRNLVKTASLVTAIGVVAYISSPYVNSENYHNPSSLINNATECRIYTKLSEKLDPDVKESLREIEKNKHLLSDDEQEQYNSAKEIIQMIDNKKRECGYENNNKAPYEQDEFFLTPEGTALA